MDFFWCLRWLQQNHVAQVTAHVLRENLVRFETLPIVTRVSDVPQLAPGTRVALVIGDIDLYLLTLECRFASVAAGDQSGASDVDENLADDGDEVEEPFVTPVGEGVAPAAP